MSLILHVISQGMGSCVGFRNPFSNAEQAFVSTACCPLDMWLQHTFIFWEQRLYIGNVYEGAQGLRWKEGKCDCGEGMLQ
jgi:hypothetical protein